MSEVQLLRGQSEESEEDIFSSTFSSAHSGKVKIAGAADHHVGLASAKMGMNGKRSRQALSNEHESQVAALGAPR